MFVIFIVAAIVLEGQGDCRDACAILTLVALNAVPGFNQQYRAQKAVAALRQLAVPTGNHLSVDFTQY